MRLKSKWGCVEILPNSHALLQLNIRLRFTDVHDEVSEMLPVTGPPKLRKHFFGDIYKEGADGCQFSLNRCRTACLREVRAMCACIRTLRSSSSRAVRESSRELEEAGFCLHSSAALGPRKYSGKYCLVHRGLLADASSSSPKGVPNRMLALSGLLLRNLN